MSNPDTLTTSETDDVLKFIAMLCAKQGWRSYAQRMESIRDRLDSTRRMFPPPLPSGSILGADNFTPCRECQTPEVCSEWDSCGYGR